MLKFRRCTIGSPKCCTPRPGGLVLHHPPTAFAQTRRPRKWQHCAIEVSGPGSTQETQQGLGSELDGQVSSELIQSMTQKITEALGAESVKVVDNEGDGRHVSIEVVSSQFEGKTSVKRQQAVYKAIWLELQSTVHAVDSMTTKTPAEAEQS